MKLGSYALGAWHQGIDDGVLINDAVYGEPVAQVSSAGLDFGAMVEYARKVGGPNLRRYTFHERAAMLRALALHLQVRKEEFYALSYKPGPPVTIVGLISTEHRTLFSYSSASPP